MLNCNWGQHRHGMTHYAFWMTILLFDDQKCEARRMNMNMEKYPGSRKQLKKKLILVFKRYTSFSLDLSLNSNETAMRL